MEFVKRRLDLTPRDLRALSGTYAHDTVSRELYNLLVSMHDCRCNDLWYDLYMYGTDHEIDYNSAYEYDIQQLCVKVERGMASKKRKREKGMMLVFYDSALMSL